MACPVCQSNANATALDPLARTKQIECPRCGRFRFTDLFEISRPNLTPLEIATISGWLREHPAATADDWEKLRSIRPPSVGEKADKLLMMLTRRYPTAGQAIGFMPNPEILSTIWALDDAEANFLFNTYLAIHKQYISAPEHGGMAWKISPKGWDYIHSLSFVNRESQIGFAAMWFDAALTPLWTQGIEPAITAAGFDPKRIDRHQHNNRIDDEIIAMIRRSRFIVADFTGNRGGVYFEAGYAMGLGLPVIWTCRATDLTGVHFDNRQYNFVLWSDNALQDFRQALQFRIEATIGRGIHAEP